MTIVLLSLAGDHQNKPEPTGIGRENKPAERGMRLIKRHAMQVDTGFRNKLAAAHLAECLLVHDRPGLLWSRVLSKGLTVLRNDSERPGQGNRFWIGRGPDRGLHRLLFTSQCLWQRRGGVRNLLPKLAFLWSQTAAGHCNASGRNA